MEIIRKRAEEEKKTGKLISFDADEFFSLIDIFIDELADEYPEIYEAKDVERLKWYLINRISEVLLEEKATGMKIEGKVFTSPNEIIDYLGDLSEFFERVVPRELEDEEEELEEEEEEEERELEDEKEEEEEEEKNDEEER